MVALRYGASVADFMADGAFVGYHQQWELSLWLTRRLTLVRRSLAPVAELRHLVVH